MMNEYLTNRQEVILNCVVDTHIQTAQPVGSRMITERYRLQSSPATVRHEMGVLEYHGFLMHPHTSSGRIPTDRGYRYYVDHSPVSWTAESASIPDGLMQELSDASDEIELFGEKVSGVLSQLAEETSLVIMEEGSSEDSLEMKSRYFLQGTSYILDKPEFQDLQKVKPLLKAFEEKRGIGHWVTRRTKSDGVNISIGTENEPEVLRECTVVTTRYTTGQSREGMLAVVGPTRLDYAKTVSLVRQMAQMIQQVIQHTDRD